MASTSEASTSERPHWPTLVVGGVFFLVGAILGGVGLWKLCADSRAINGERTRAEVLRKAIHADRTQGSSVRARHRVEYRFQPAAGEAVSAAAHVTPELWARLEPGAPIEVEYLQSDPSTQRVEGEERDATVWIVFGLVGALFAPLGAWLARNGLPRAQAAELRVIPQSVVAWFAASPALAFGMLGALFFLCFFVAGVFWLTSVRSAQELFELRGQAVEGLVLSKAIVRKRSSSGRGAGSSESTHYQVVYRFQVQGADVVGTSYVDAGDWEALKERGPIAVAYVGGSPWLHRLEGDGAGWIVPMLFVAVGGFGALGSAGAGWWFSHRVPRRRKAVPRPEPRVEVDPEGKPKAPGGRGWLIGTAVGALFFAGGCGALATGIGDFLTERRYGVEGRLADAQVVEKSMAGAERGGRRSTEYALLYRFKAADGRAAEGRATLAVAAWEAAKAGDRMRVRYLATDPGVNRAADEGGYAMPVVLLLIGPLFALIGAFLAWGSWLARKER